MDRQLDQRPGDGSELVLNCPRPLTSEDPTEGENMTTAAMKSPVEAAKATQKAKGGERKSKAAEEPRELDVAKPSTEKVGPRSIADMIDQSGDGNPGGVNLSDIRIDPEFSALIPPPSAEEQASLEQAILAERGCRDALLVW